MVAKIATAQKRMFENVFVCKNCSKKVRANPVKINAGLVKCPRCNKRSFRAIRRKK